MLNYDQQFWLPHRGLIGPDRRRPSSNRFFGGIGFDACACCDGVTTPTGPCCESDDTCSIKTQAECQSGGGYWLGDYRQSCTGINCVSACRCCFSDTYQVEISVPDVGLRDGFGECYYMHSSYPGNYVLTYDPLICNWRFTKAATVIHDPPQHLDGKLDYYLLPASGTCTETGTQSLYVSIKYSIYNSSYPAWIVQGWTYWEPFSVVCGSETLDGKSADYVRTVRGDYSDECDTDNPQQVTISV